ncbi:MAG TPA: PTS sugar transporter subunit IIA [Nevskiaceae bacterium]|nr:PTS sugar transporter subunit IIA [Nevskiaceae bacterium]
MKLSQILSADRVAVGVVSASKKRTLEEVSTLLAHGSVSLSGTDILSSLAGREKLGSTGLGHGVAIPHGRVAGVTGTVGAFIRLRYPIDYESHDGQAVDLVFGLLVPENSTSEHLQHLAAVAERFSDEDFCAKIRAASDAGQVFALLAA